MVTKQLKVLLGGNNLYTELLDALKSKVRPSSHIILTKVNYDEAIGKVQYRPFISSHYVVEIHMDGLTSAQVKDLKKLLELGWVQGVFIFTKMKNYEDFSLPEEYKLYEFNGYRPQDTILYRFITKRTPHIDTEYKFKIIKWHLAGHYNLLEHYLTQINDKAPSTVAQLKKIVPRYKRVNFWRLFNQLITGEKPKDSFRMLNEYPFGGKFILTIFKEFSESMLLMYEDFYEGKFNRTNLTEYQRGPKPGEFDLRDYQVPDALTLFENYSFDYLLLIDTTLAKAMKQKDLNYEAILTALNILTIKERAKDELRRNRKTN